MFSLGKSWWVHREFSLANVTFRHHRSDPVFSAQRYRTSPDGTVTWLLDDGYFNDQEFNSVNNCQESAEICSVDERKCGALHTCTLPPGLRLNAWRQFNYADLNERQLTRFAARKCRLGFQHNLGKRLGSGVLLQPLLV